jgi:two-component system, sensor histidine kinase
MQQEALSDRQADLVNRMSQELAALRAMLDTLLDLCQIDAGATQPHPKLFSLASLLRRVAERFAPEAEAHRLRLSLRLSREAGEALVHGDPLMVELVLANLLGNAIQYTAQGGILLSCRARSARSPMALVGRRIDVRHWQVEVWDTGVGIAEPDRLRIFDEFEQLGRPSRDGARGLGLGLSIVGRLVRALDLGLSLVSRVGRGSHWTLSLPMPTRAQRQAGVEAGADWAPGGDAAPWLAGACIALIEDDVFASDATSTLLSTWGCQVLVGTFGADPALRSASGRVPDAVIVDYRLNGGRTGVAEAQSLMASLGRQLPVLVVSGDTAPDAAEAIRAAGYARLGKPVHPVALKNWVAQATRSDTRPTPGDRP